MILSFPTLTNPTLPIPTQLKNRVWGYGNRGIMEMAWHEKTDGTVNYHPSLQSSPLDNVVGGKSTTSTTARGAVVGNLANYDPGFQKTC